MSETNFFGLERRHYDPLAKSPRPLVVPERPSTPRSVPHNAVHRAPFNAPPTKHMRQSMDMVVKPRPQPVTSKPEPKSVPIIKPHPAIIPIDDLLNDFVEAEPKVEKPVEAKKARVKLAHKLAARKQEKAKKSDAKKMAKTPKAPKTPKVPKTHAKKTNFTTQALKVAANSIDTDIQHQVPMPTLNGEAVAESENVLSRLPKISFEIKINKKRVFAFIRTILILTILAVSGYLAWDTWVVNQAALETFSGSAAAVAIDEAGPSGADVTSISNQAWSTHAAPADQARYVYLPSINAQARVMSVGINSKGKIDSPKNVNDVAWYDGSAKPGQEGQVFINGNASFASTYKAAFDNLSKLDIGDRITIELGDGKVISYRVVSNETVAADKIDMKKMLDVPDGAARGLTLMGCTGKFNYRTESSDTRVIIQAVQE